MSENGKSRKFIWVSKEVLRLLKVIAGDKTLEHAILLVLNELYSGSSGVDEVFKTSIHDKAVKVSKQTWELLTNAKYDLRYRTYNDLLAEAIMVYLYNRGICKECIMRLAELSYENE